MIDIHWTHKCTHCFVVYVSQIMLYTSNFYNAVSILSQRNWKGKKGETTCKGPRHTESPTKSQSKSPCFLFLSQTPLEDHRCLGHRPELEPAHSTLLLKPCVRFLPGNAAPGGWGSLLPTFPPHLPQLLSPAARPTTGLSQIFQQFWRLFALPGICTPSRRLLLLLQGAAPLRSRSWPSPPPPAESQGSALWVPSGLPVAALITQRS